MQKFQAPDLINLSEIVREVLLDMEPIIETSKAQIEIEINDCFVVKFPPKNLRSVIYNLLSNAIEYKSSDRIPAIEVRCDMTHDYSILSVKDNGLGMDLSEGIKIFSMFKRFHNHVEGSGIDLYMVKRIVENGGGKVEVESKIGDGSTFKVYSKR